MNKYIVIGILVLIAAFPVTAETGYGIGVHAGYQLLSYPFLENLKGWNNDSPLAFYGGYGYHVTDGGMIAGGFGSLIVDRRETDTGGAVGGFILGKRYTAGPVNVSIISWTGFGPVSTAWGVEDLSIDGETGFICFMEEVDLEIGVPLFHWLMPTAYVGFQVIGNIHEWDNFNGFVSYAPIVGIRLQFGEFNYGLFDK
jgi:hypothetical protein